jgi:hypothetical protein
MLAEVSFAVVLGLLSSLLIPLVDFVLIHAPHCGPISLLTNEAIITSCCFITDQLKIAVCCDRRLAGLRAEKRSTNQDQKL